MPNAVYKSNMRHSVSGALRLITGPAPWDGRKDFVMRHSVYASYTVYWNMKHAVVAMAVMSSTWDKSIMILSNKPLDRETAADRKRYILTDNSGGSFHPRSVVTMRNERSSSVDDNKIVTGVLLEVPNLVAGSLYTVEYVLKDTEENDMIGKMEVLSV